MPKSTFTPAYGLLLEALLELRRTSGVTQVELSKRLGKPQPFISNIERGVRRIDLIEFYAITRALGADPQAVFGELVRKLPKKVAI
jgi:transcriptional regulator with XRE-family HTH domain